MPRIISGYEDRDPWMVWGHLASPYELLLEYDIRGDVTLVMLGDVGTQRYTLRRMVVRDMFYNHTQAAIDTFVREEITDMRREMRTKIVEGKNCPNVRLWMAENDNQDWALSVESVAKLRIDEWAAQAHPYEIYTDPIEAEAVRKSRALREQKEKEEMAKIARVATPSAPKKRAPMCPVHEVAFEFDPDENIWLCRKPRKGGKPGQTCNLRQGPRLERSNGELLMGEGRVELQIVVIKPDDIRFVLVASNNVALDITGMVVPRDIVGYEKIRRVYNECVHSEDDKRRVVDTVVAPVSFDAFTIMGAGSNG